MQNYANSDSTGGVHKLVYTCPMHSEVTSDKPGKCPKCGMTLEVNKKENQKIKGGEKQ